MEGQEMKQESVVVLVAHVKKVKVIVIQMKNVVVILYVVEIIVATNFYGTRQIVVKYQVKAHFP